MPGISVITAVYNTADYLETCIGSMLAQTFTDWEWLLLDDGSSDDSLQICRRYAGQDARIRVFHHENRGLAYTRNVGMCEATGAYLCFLDSDDYLDDTALAYLWQIAQQTQADIVTAGLLLEKDGHTRAYTTEEMLLNEDSIRAHLPVLKASHLLDTCVDKLYRASFVKKAGVTMPQGEIFEDTAFNLELLTHPFTMACCPVCFYHYVQRQGSITKRFNPDKAPILKKRWQALCRLAGGNRDFCAMYYLTSVYSCLIDDYMPSAHLTAAQRRARRRAVLNDADYRDCLEKARAVGKSQKVTLLVARCRLSCLTALYTRFCYCLKYRLSSLFLKLK